jgi:hypothetical protein
MLCRCGHDEDLHVHYRAGSDCAWRGCDCWTFRSAGWWRRLLRRLQ